MYRTREMFNICRLVMLGNYWEIFPCKGFVISWLCNCIHNYKLSYANVKIAKCKLSTIKVQFKLFIWSRLQTSERKNRYCSYCAAFSCSCLIGITNPISSNFMRLHHTLAFNFVSGHNPWWNRIKKTKSSFSFVRNLGKLVDLVNHVNEENYWDIF